MKWEVLQENIASEGRAWKMFVTMCFYEWYVVDVDLDLSGVIFFCCPSSCLPYFVVVVVVVVIHSSVWL